jgi:hypothetical protein
MIDRNIIFERIESRNFDYYIPKREIRKKIFNNEIYFTLISSEKSIIPDWISFFISVLGATGSDEFDMVNTELSLIKNELFLKEVDDFQRLWKLNLKMDEYLQNNIRNVHQVDINPSRKNYNSEISYIVETETSFVYFFTGHLYY